MTGGRLRLLAFADHLSPASGGGAERVAAEVYGRLVRDHDVELTVVTVLRPGHRAWKVPGARTVTLTGRDLSGLVGAEMLLASGLARYARRVHAEVRPHVVHANGLHFQGSLVAAGLARRTGTPLVTTAHLGDLAALGPRLRLGGTAWDRTLGRRVLRASRRVVAVSTAVSEHVDTLAGCAARTVVAPNGVDAVRFTDAGRDPVGSAPGLRAVFVGRLVANKGPWVALDAVTRAFAAGAPVTLDVVGDGPLRPALARAVAERGLGSSVRLDGHVDDVASRLRRADVLLRPSFTEGLPLAVLEGMACGLPVVCSSIPGNTEVVTHDVDGWHTRPGSAGDVAAALVTLAGDRARLRRLAMAASATAAAHTWERSARQHAEALRAAASLPSALPVPSRGAQP